MLFSCYNITKCTLTTDRQIATTRARMVHGQTVHIWWNEWKASCLLLPPHFPYRNPFRRSFSFVLFPQENVEKFSVKKKQTAVAWSIRVEQVRHLVFVWEWRKTPHRCCWMGKAFSPSTTPVYRFIHRCFSTNSCLFLFFFYELNVGPGGLVLWDTGASEKPRLWDLSSIDYIDSVSIDNTFSRMFMLMVQTQIAYREKQHCERITDAW